MNNQNHDILFHRAFLPYVDGFVVKIVELSGLPFVIIFSYSIIQPQC